MLRLEGVDLRLGDFRLSVDATVGRGERVAVLGASGSGKSTLLSLLAGFVLPVAGRITWEGRDLTALSPAERPMSILFQDGNLFPHLTVAQNVGLALRRDLRLSGDRSARRSTTRWSRWGSRAWAAGDPPACRAGSRGARPWRGCCCRTGPSHCWMSRLPALDPGLQDRDAAPSDGRCGRRAG
jgi:thiamine transport system ATP-binding protein